MSTALQKAAWYTPFSPQQLLLLSTAAGGAGFGGMRLINDMYEKMNPLQAEDNSIKLQLPNPHKKHDEPADMSGMGSVNAVEGSGIPAISKTATVALPPPDPTPSVPASDAPPWYANSLAIGAGLPLGFLGAKSIYDHYQGNQRQKDVEEAKKQYSYQLMLAQQMSKGASETPRVDKICEAMADEFEKSAGNWGVRSLAAGSAGAGLAAGLPVLYNHEAYGDTSPSVIPSITKGDATKLLANHAPPDALQSADSEIGTKGWDAVRAGFRHATLGTTSAYGDIFEGLTGAATIGTLGLLLYNHAKKKAKEQKATYPTSVTYAD